MIDGIDRWRIQTSSPSIEMLLSHAFELGPRTLALKGTTLAFTEFRARIRSCPTSPPLMTCNAETYQICKSHNFQLSTV
jgi:hypothetical protein